jgi:hypothetical protein
VGAGAATAVSWLLYDPDEAYSSLIFVFVPPLGAIGGMIGGGVTDADVKEFRFPSSSGRPATE